MEWDEQFASFVCEHSGSLFSAAFVLTGDRHRADDLVQETLCRLYPNWGRVQGSTAPLAYVRKALVNRFLAESRRRMSGEQPWAELPDRVNDDAAEMRVDDRLMIAIPLAALPPKQRAAVTMHFLYDLADRDSAEAMSCTVHAFRAHLRRGLRELRAAMTVPAGAVPTKNRLV